MSYVETFEHAPVPQPGFRIGMILEIEYDGTMAWRYVYLPLMPVTRIPFPANDPHAATSYFYDE